MTQPFVPSPYLLNNMIAAAMAKCDADIEQTNLRKQARRDEMYARGEASAVRARHYARIQHGVV